jgi:hypothetical protein
VVNQFFRIHLRDGPSGVQLYHIPHGSMVRTGGLVGSHPKVSHLGLFSPAYASFWTARLDADPARMRFSGAFRDLFPYLFTGTCSSFVSSVPFQAKELEHVPHSLYCNRFSLTHPSVHPGIHPLSGFLQRGSDLRAGVPR